MIYKERYIELWVNGNKVEIESQKSINIRFNNVLLDPTKVSSTQAEYSFEFEVPCTPKNNVIFDYANNLAKNDKFHQRYNAEVYADGIVIFTGTITINSIKDNKYSLNLVSVKVYSLDEIFGDMTMDKIKDWKIDFNGVDSINAYNASQSPDVVFPFVSYGVFQKEPYNTDEVSDDYTSKFDLDEYNMWYVESFYPSHKMLTTLKKAFESKDYTVDGDVFDSNLLNDVYMSVNLADGQTPDYNVGNPSFGKVDVSVNFTTSGSGYEQELRYPYFKVYGTTEGSINDDPTSSVEYNFPAVNIYDMLGNSGVTLNNTPSYMYQPNEGVIVIPASGFYKIELTTETTLNTTGTIYAKQWLEDMITRERYDENIGLTPSLGEITPVEIALIRNYDDNYELIKGKDNRKYHNGNPNDEYYVVSGRRWENIKDWQTCFPHEDPYTSELPTEAGDLKTKNNQSNRGGVRGGTGDSSSSTGRGGTRGGTIEPSSDRRYSPMKYGYIYNDNEMMCYDQVVSDTFICGLSSMSGGVPAVMKNGYSWSNMTSEKNNAFAPVYGYSMLSREAETGNLVYEQTTHNENTYINTPISYCYLNKAKTTMNGYVSCMVWLKKDDVLRLVEVHRNYATKEGSAVNYSTTSSVNLKIQAFSNRSYDMIKASNDNRYDAPVEFDTQLNLPNFLNNEKKVSEWVQNIADAFNLDIIQNGKNITINTRKKTNTNVVSTVEIDDRVNSANAESKAIDYPKSMAVKYKIDTDEWGFERSAVDAAGGDESILNNDDWIKYGDSGFTVVYLNDDSYVTTTSDKNLQFSYTWYQNFNWYAVDSAFTKTSDNAVTLRIPCISKYSYMIDGYDYAESMKHDGYGQPQRFWFKGAQASWATNQYVWTRTYPVERVWLYTPSNMYTNYSDSYFNLSYKNTENSILTEFFNVNAYLASNYVEIDVYLSADEYNMIKNGSLVHFDSDLYIPVEISGYDPSGINPTTLRIMKKVV